MNTEYCVTAHWQGGFSESGLQKWAEELRSQLLAQQVSLGLVFMSQKFFSHAKQVLEILRVHAQIPLLAGCSGNSLIVDGAEIEEDAGLALALYSMPAAKLSGIHFVQEQVEEANAPGYWRTETGVDPDQTNGWLAFIDPFHIDSELWMQTWNEAYAPLPVFGGLASGDFREQSTQVYLNGDVFDEGGVAVSIGGEVRLAGVISQGCTPIGDTWTLTRVQRNLIQEIGNRPAYAVLAETFNRLPADEQRKTQGNVFIGLVVNEYLDEFHRGDFLVRNLLGGDPQSGIIAVGALPRAGQTVQFQRRDAAAAAEDMDELLTRARQQLTGATIYGGCLCSCNGRGRNLFGKPSHDAQTIQRQLGPLGLAGFFCNGEIGPIGEKNFLHGYTASLVLFVKK